MNLTDTADNAKTVGATDVLVAFAQSEAGQTLLRMADGLPADRLTRLTRLRKECSPENAAFLVNLLELRKRARSKFSRAAEMFFTDEGLQQSTGEVIAHYRAARFPVGVPVLDVCCGIGGDALALQRRGPVVGIEASPLHAACSRANMLLAEREGCGHSGAVVCQDALTLDLDRMKRRGIHAAFFDPSRRRDDAYGQRRRAAYPDDYSPPLDWLLELQTRFPSLAVKISPALPDDVYCRYPGATVEFISEDGECKEAVLWFGDLAAPLADATARAPEPYTATVLCAGQPPATLMPFACVPLPVSPPLAWLYEPDPAIIRAHLVPQAAALLNAAALDAQIAYLTAETFQPSPFATGYRILEALPFNLKAVQRRLRERGLRVVAIKKRGVPLEVEELRGRLTGDENASAQAVVTLTRIQEKMCALLCEPPWQKEGRHADDRGAAKRPRAEG